MFFSSRFQNIPIFKNRLQGTSLVVQRFTAGNMDAIPGQGSKFPHAIQCGRKKKEKEKKNRLHKEQFQVHHKTGVAGAEYAQVLTCTAFPKSSIPTRGHVCCDWPPRVQSFTGVHSWVHIPRCLDRSWHAPTTTAPHSIGSLSSPHLPPPKPWQPPSLSCLHRFVISTMSHGDSYNSTPSHQPFVTAFFHLVMSF